MNQVACPKRLLVNRCIVYYIFLLSILIPFSIPLPQAVQKLIDERNLKVLSIRVHKHFKRELQQHCITLSNLRAQKQT
jgi:hypothetical protein